MFWPVIGMKGRWREEWPGLVARGRNRGLSETLVLYLVVLYPVVLYPIFMRGDGYGPE